MTHTHVINEKKDKSKKKGKMKKKNHHEFATMGKKLAPPSLITLTTSSPIFCGVLTTNQNPLWW